MSKLAQLSVELLLSPASNGWSERTVFAFILFPRYKFNTHFLRYLNVETKVVCDFRLKLTETDWFVKVRKAFSQKFAFLCFKCSNGPTEHTSLSFDSLPIKLHPFSKTITDIVMLCVF